MYRFISFLIVSEVGYLLSSRVSGSGAGRKNQVRELDGNVDDSHVGGEELREVADAVTRHAVERVAHGAVVMVTVLAQSTVVDSLHGAGMIYDQVVLCLQLKHLEVNSQQ